MACDWRDGFANNINQGRAWGHVTWNMGRLTEYTGRIALLHQFHSLAILVRNSLFSMSFIHGWCIFWYGRHAIQHCM